MTDLDSKIREFEIYSSKKIIPDVYFALRLDGRSFSKLTENLGYARPFDENFKRTMISVSSGLQEEFNSLLSYTQSDEISLVFDKNTDLFNRRVEKLLSTAASYASCKFSLKANLEDQVVMFDSRLIVLPNKENIVDYLHSRHIDAVRNALNSWCYWTLRKDGNSERKATSIPYNKNKVFKNELLFQHDINFNNLPLWQRRGILLLWEEYEKNGIDPRSNEEKIAIRRRIKANEELPTGDEFREYISVLLN